MKLIMSVLVLLRTDIENPVNTDRFCVGSYGILKNSIKNPRIEANSYRILEFPNNLISAGVGIFGIFRIVAMLRTFRNLSPKRPLPAEERRRPSPDRVCLMLLGRAGRHEIFPRPLKFLVPRFHGVESRAWGLGFWRFLEK